MILVDSLLTEDLAAFADLGTEPPRGAIQGDRLTVRMFRQGEELELQFHDGGAGKVIERSVDTHESRTHASYRALLASERWGNLRGWTDHQKKYLRQTLRDIGPPIPVKGLLQPGDTLIDLRALDDRLVEQSHEVQSVHIMLIDGPAGIGKTTFIDLLARSRADGYLSSRRPLILHVKSRGRVLTFLQDLIAFSLQALRLSVTFDQLPVLVRHGLVTLAIDGFDELADPNGYDLAWNQVNEIVDQVRGIGTLILAGRETFIGHERIKANITSLTERDDVHVLSLQAPPPATAKGWLNSNGWSEDNLRDADELFEPDSYALRPFFLSQLANPEAVSAIQHKIAGSPLAFLVELMVDREAGTFGDAVDSVLDEDQRRSYVRRLLREVARSIAEDGTEAIDERMLEWLVDMVMPEDTSSEVIARLKHRAAVMAFLEKDDAPNYRRFAHSQVFNHFLSEETIDAVVNGEVPKYVRRNIMGADFLTAFNDLVLDYAGRAPERIRDFFEAASGLVETYSRIDQGVRNLGAWLVTMLPAMEGADNLMLRNLDMDEALIRGTAPSAAINNVVVNQLDVRGADLQDLTFVSATVTTLIVDETTRVPPSLPVPSRIQCEGFRDRSTAVITNPISIERWLDRHGRNDLPTEQGVSGLVPNELRDRPLPKLLGRACRSKMYWIPLDQKGGFPQFVTDPRWGELLSLLEDHGLARRERKSMSGRGTDLFHIRRSKDILNEDEQDHQIRTFYESLVERIRA